MSRDQWLGQLGLFTAERVIMTMALQSLIKLFKFRFCFLKSNLIILTSIMLFQSTLFKFRKLLFVNDMTFRHGLFVFLSLGLKMLFIDVTVP